MRFNAKLSNPVLFLQVLLALEKLGKQIIVHLSPAKVSLIMNETMTEGELVFVEYAVESDEEQRERDEYRDAAGGASGGGGLVDGTESHPRSLFRDFRVESKSNNSIVFSTQIANLVKALRSGCEKSNKTVLRLAKKSNNTFLTVTMEIQEMLVVQDVPITLLNVSKLEDCKIPEVERPKVKTTLPPSDTLFAVVERMRNFSDTARLTMTNKGSGRLFDFFLASLCFSRRGFFNTVSYQFGRASITVGFS